jgi:CheY-like chemotaxis protein
MEDGATRRSVAAMLRLDGSEIEEAGDGVAVLEKLSDSRACRSRPDVIVMDLLMSTCSGLFVLTAVRRAGLRAKVLLLNERCHASIREYAENLGAHVVAPPTEAGALRTAFGRLLSNGRERSQAALVA